MKAMVYMAETRNGWRPRWTVAWDVDEQFWLDPVFCRGVLEGAGISAKAIAAAIDPVNREKAVAETVAEKAAVYQEDGSATVNFWGPQKPVSMKMVSTVMETGHLAGTGVVVGEHPLGVRRLVVLRSPLPLGIAEAAVRLLESRRLDGGRERGKWTWWERRKWTWRTKAGKGVPPRRKKAGGGPVPRFGQGGQTLGSLGKGAKTPGRLGEGVEMPGGTGKDAGMPGSLGEDGAILAQCCLVRAANLCRAAADDATGRTNVLPGDSDAERASGIEAPFWSLNDTVVLGPENQWRTENAELRRDRGRRLGRLARQASASLAGRSLLPEEAQRLFADTLPELKPGEWLAVAQTAHLLGLVELQAALEPPVPYEFRDLERHGLASHSMWVSWVRELLRADFPFRHREALRCRRCGGGQAGMRSSPCASCGRICAVCEACLTMGRCRECELLMIGKPLQARDGAGTGLRLPATLARNPEEWLSKWNLSPAQREASAQALAFIRRTLGRTSKLSVPTGDRPTATAGDQKFAEERKLAEAQWFRGERRFAGERKFEGEQKFLLWAVTGAGKTEMIFPLLESVLAAGGRALVATPRRDVVLELAPRLARAFGEDRLSVRYGGSPDRKFDAPLTLATTHQLLRFQGAFDLVLIDELDAFPYHGDPMLQYAAAKARKPDGVTVLLTATPPRALQREVRRGRLPCAKVPVRYHRHPLPEPRRLPLPELARMLRTRRLPRRLLRALRRSVEAGSSLFVFVPYIRQAEAFAALLREHAEEIGLDAGQIAGTSSQDPEREAKVQAFRKREVRLLVATTILERGVTVPRSDVFILDADHAMFDETALVQMAGRAGRSADAPDGRVYFGGRTMTVAERRAIRHIRAMNRLARRKGYLFPPSARPQSSRISIPISLFRTPARRWPR